MKKPNSKFKHSLKCCQSSRRDDNQSPTQRSPQFEQPELFHFFGEKPQISSIPGISPKQRDRYRVLLGNEILGDRLTLERAIELAKGGR